MKIVKIKVTGDINRFIAKRKNNLIFIDYTEDLKGAYFWLKYDSYTRKDAKLYFDKVEFLETKEI